MLGCVPTRVVKNTRQGGEDLRYDKKGGGWSPVQAQGLRNPPLALDP